MVFDRKIHDKTYREKNKEKRVKYVQEYNNKFPERVKSQYRTKKLRKDYCEICRGNRNLDFHHVDYEKDKGFTVCGSCHKLCCKEGRIFEDSLRLYEEEK